jgi:hypothetical protein
MNDNLDSATRLLPAGASLVTSDDHRLDKRALPRQIDRTAPDLPSSQRQLEAPVQLDDAAPPSPSAQDRAERLLDHLSARHATFTSRHLHLAAIQDPDRRAIVAAALRADRLVALGPDSAGAIRYTTRAYLDCESNLFAAATALSQRQDLRFRADETAPLRRLLLDYGQRDEAATAVITGSADLVQIVGRDRSRKDSLIHSIFLNYPRQGCSVSVAVLDRQAAQSLQRHLGVPVGTLRDLEQAWSRGDNLLHPRSILVIDDAGRINAPHLSRILQEVERRGAKVILMADPNRLHAVGPGDAYRGLLERLPRFDLDQTHHHARGEPSPPRDLAHPQYSAMLESSAARDRLHWTADRGEAENALLSAYRAARADDPRIAQLVVTYSADDARRLTETLRAERLAGGELGRPVRYGDREFAVGDPIVLFRQGPQDLDSAHFTPPVTSLTHDPTESPYYHESSFVVRHSVVGTVDVAGPGNCEVALVDGRRAAFNPERYSSFHHAYALTAHESRFLEGLHIYALADPRMDRDASYFQLAQRGRVDLFADRESFLARSTALPGRSHPSDLAADYAAANLHRAATPVSAHHDRIAMLEADLRTLGGQVALHERAGEAHAQILIARSHVDAAAASIYADPARATAALLADPKAPDRLAAGDASRYGELLGRHRLFLAPDAARSAAERAVPMLRESLLRLQRHESLFSTSLTAVRALPSTLADLQSQVRHTAATLERVRFAAQGPERALELLVRNLGVHATRAAVALLPQPLRLPVELALRPLIAVLGKPLQLGPSH